MRLAWKELCHKYADVSENSLIALMMELNVFKMKNAIDDPPHSGIQS